MTESIIALILAVLVTIYSIIRSAQTWRKEGWVFKLFSIAFALLATAMAKVVYLGIMETIK